MPLPPAIATATYVRVDFGRQRRLLMGPLAALLKRYVRCVVDVNHVDLRVFAVGVGVGAPSLAVNNRPLTTRTYRARVVAGARGGCAARVRDRTGAGGGRRQRSLISRRLPLGSSLIAPLTFPTSRRAVSSFLSYVVHAFGVVARASHVDYMSTTSNPNNRGV